MALDWTTVGISTLGALVLGVCSSYCLVTRGSVAVRWGLVLALLLVIINLRLAALGLVGLICGIRFRDLNQAYRNDARSLGASEWSIFWRVMLPMSWRWILAAAVVAFARSLTGALA